MKQIFFVSVIGLSAMGLGLEFLRAEEPVAETPAAQASTAPVFLFLGDSITRAGGYVGQIGAELTKQNPATPPQFINHGRNSETASDLSEAYHPGRRPCVLARLDAELAEAKPNWVVACYGINDGIYHPFNEKRFAAYQAGIEALIKKVQATGASLILLTPPPYAHSGPVLEGANEAAREELINNANAAAEVEAEKDPNKFGYKTPYPYYDEVMARYAKWLLTLNGRDKVWVIDVRTPMLARIKETHGRDPIHPSSIGHSIMAEAFLQQWPTIEAQSKAK